MSSLLVPSRSVYAGWTSELGSQFYSGRCASRSSLSVATRNTLFLLIRAVKPRTQLTQVIIFNTTYARSANLIHQEMWTPVLQLEEISTCVLYSGMARLGLGHHEHHFHMLSSGALNQHVRSFLDIRIALLERYAMNFRHGRITDFHI